MRPIITKVLINIHWRLNSIIDNNAGKPADVDREHWKTLIAMGASEAAQVKSEHMRSISKGKGSTTAQMKAIEREVVSRLGSHLPCYVEADVVVGVILIRSRMTSFMTNHVCHSVYIGGKCKLRGESYLCYELMMYAMVGILILFQ